MIDIFLYLISAGSFFGVFYIILSKFPQLASIKTSLIPSEQQLTVRNRLIYSRLKDKLTKKSFFVSRKVRPFWSKFTSFFWRLYNKILEKESYLHTLAMTPEQKEEAKTQTDTLLSQALDAVNEKMFMRAERLYIKVISLDPHNLDAYDGLANMYLTQRDYQKSLETLKYLLAIAKRKIKRAVKEGGDASLINKKIIDYYLKLGQLLQYNGKNSEALKCFNSAVRLDDKDPRSLDQLLEMSIIMKDSETAKDTLKKIIEVNPENNKITEWEKRIEDLDN